jgi:hypothetical protein
MRKRPRKGSLHAFLWGNLLKDIYEKHVCFNCCFSVTSKTLSQLVCKHIFYVFLVNLVNKDCRANNIKGLKGLKTHIPERNTLHVWIAV